MSNVSVDNYCNTANSLTLNSIIVRTWIIMLDCGENSLKNLEDSITS